MEISNNINRAIAAAIIKILVFLSRVAITVRLWRVQAFVDKDEPSGVIG